MRRAPIRFAALLALALTFSCAPRDHRLGKRYVMLGGGHHDQSLQANLTARAWDKAGIAFFVGEGSVGHAIWVDAARKEEAAQLARQFPASSHFTLYPEPWETFESVSPRLAREILGE